MPNVGLFDAAAPLPTVSQISIRYVVEVEGLPAEDFTEFEQRPAYFNGDPIHAMKKGAFVLDRVIVSHMTEMQNNVRLSAGTETESRQRPTRPEQGERKRNPGERTFSLEKRSAAIAIRHRTISTI